MGHWSLIKKRRENLKPNNIIIPELIYNQSIVKKYFIEGKKYFSHIERSLKKLNII